MTAIELSRNLIGAIKHLPDGDGYISVGTNNERSLFFLDNFASQHFVSLSKKNGKSNKNVYLSDDGIVLAILN